VIRKDDSSLARLAPRARSRSRAFHSFDPGLAPGARAARQRLAALLVDPGPLPLLEATLLIAAEEHLEMDIAAQIARVETIGAMALERVMPLLNPFARIEAVRMLLYEEIGFRGNVSQYDDPKNSYLDDVLERKLGIPLTLSMIHIEVLRAAGFEAEGVGLPGHFIVRGRRAGAEPPRGPVPRRPHRHRRGLQGPRRPHDRPRLALPARLARHRPAPDDADPSPPESEAHPPRRRGLQPALSIVERLLLIAPADAKEIRDRGLLLAHLGQPGAAVDDLESYLALAPQAPDADSVRGRLAWILKKMADPV
jgi:regulator of sirC expression with transglutaminase-like and TPR domain